MQRPNHSVLRPGRKMVDQQRANLVRLLRSFVHEQHPPTDLVGSLGAEQWAILAEEAEAQSVAPVVFRLVEQAVVALPPAVRDRLRLSYERSAMGTAAALVQLEQLLTVLAAAGGEPPMLLKGMALAPTVYPSLALRPVRDIDLLIRPGDCQAVRGVAEELGYTPEPIVAPTRRHAEILAEEATAHSYLPPDGTAGLHLDIHTEPVPGLDTGSIPLWDGAVGRPVGSARACVPRDEHLLLLLLLHVAKHRAGSGVPPRLLWWLDVALVLRKLGARLDWDQFVAAGRRLSAEAARLAAQCLVTVDAVFAPGSTPDQVVEALCPGAELGRSVDLFHKASGVDLRTARVLMARSERLASPFARLWWVGGYVLPRASYVRASYGIQTRRGLLGWYALRPFTALRELVQALRSRPRADRSSR